MINLTPRQTVIELDKYIIGQTDAKKSVAIALRNRYRRKQLPFDMADEIYPKNIIMIGPTGVGKTEIARRLAKLVNAPFIKVEATKFTEIGYVGKDVESMIRDLVETSIRLLKKEMMDKIKEQAHQMVEKRLINFLLPPKKKNEIETEENDEFSHTQQVLLQKLRNGEYEETYIEIEVEQTAGQPMVEVFPVGAEEIGMNLQDLFGGLIPKKRKLRKMKIKDARKILEQEEAQKLIDMDDVISKAVLRAEQDGIIFLDEIDKIAGSEKHGGPDVSRGGVQRDILPIVEGSTVMTKYGPVKTDHILFIAAGAFHVTKPSDLIPELQGRFPIRVELKSLSEEDFKNILIEPSNSLIKQYKALLETEGVDLHFHEDGISAIANIAYRVNAETENIGARRLHTILEKLLEEVLFLAPEASITSVEITEKYVRERLDDIVKDKDLSKYIL